MAAEAKDTGNAAFKSGDYQAAVTAYGLAIDLAPPDHTLYSNRSAAYAKLKKGQLALSDAEECVNIKGDFARGWQRKGQALELLGRMREAVEAYRAGLDMNPDNQALKDAFRAADARERASPPSSSPAPAPAATSSRAPAPSPRASSNDQVQKTEDERAQELMQVDVPSAVLNFAKVHWMGTSLWIIGVLIMLVLPAPVQVSEEMEAEYDSIMMDANLQFGAKIATLNDQVYDATTAANNAYGWFLNERETQVYNDLFAKQKKMERVRAITSYALVSLLLNPHVHPLLLPLSSASSSTSSVSFSL